MAAGRSGPDIDAALPIGMETALSMARLGAEVNACGGTPINRASALLAANVATGNVGGAALDAAGLVYDITATAVPGLPGGASATIKACRGANAAAKSGTSVLGHFPEYLARAEQLGARRFNIPAEVWARMSDAERWAANQRFLDRLITRGDEVVLTTPIDAILRGSTLEREAQYLLGRGYEVVDDGMRLAPSP